MQGNKTSQTGEKAGWICLHRKILDWEWYDDIPTKTLFIHLLLTANHKPKKWRGREIERGALITSISSLSSATGLSSRQVRTALEHLKKTGEIDKVTTSRNTMIIVLNYCRYQDLEDDKSSITDKQATNNRQTTDKQATTNNNDNNVNNENNVNNRNNIHTVNYEQVKETFNSICKSLPPVKKMNDTRRQNIKSLLIFLDDSNVTVDEFCQKVEGSDFLTGRDGKWMNCCFDWAIKKQNALKIIEGVYDNRRTSRARTDKRQQRHVKTEV